MVLKEMIKEEWRTQSKLYRGRYLAAMPFLIAALTYMGATAVQNYSPEPQTDMGLLVLAFGFFTGLAAGSIGFNRSDAARNVLGDANFLVFSSRTLPVSEAKLYLSFLVKDLIFYTALYLLPVAVGVNLVLNLWVYTAYMGGLFLLGLFLSLLAASSYIKLPSSGSRYSYTDRLGPLTGKSILDVSRSSGGLFKILASMGVLLGLYWYVVNYVPIASYLTENPLLSFSVILGMMSVTVYNWLNTYDEASDYGYLPVDESMLLEAKFDAFKLVSSVLVAVFLAVSYIFYGGNLLLGLVVSLSTSYYIGAILLYEAGLDPNERMIESWTFAKFLVMVNAFVIPLLALTSMEVETALILGLVVPMVAIAAVVENIKTG